MDILGRTIGAEMMKLLAPEASGALPALAAMQEDGVLPLILPWCPA